MDKTTLFSIGEFSQISGASIKSLHYYEKINILQPAWIDPENGYRYYTLKQLPFLNLIGLFLDLDIRLNHLTNEFMDEFKKIDYQSLLSYGKSVTQEKIKELNNKMRYIDFLEKTLATNNSLHIVSPYSVLWLMPCSSESKSPNIEKALKKILHDLNTYDFRFHENYGLIMFCNGKERRTYYFADVRVPVGKRILHENIFYLPEGEYRHIEQPELNLTKVPKLFKDLFAIPYDKIVIVTPAQTGYTLSCLLPPHMPALQL